MSMLNQAAVEALCSATYLESYLECMDALPEEMQRFITVLRELDSQCNDLLIEIEQLKLGLSPDPDATTRKRTLQLIQRNLIKCQELGDEKIQIVSQIIEVVENRSRQLHQDFENLDPIGGGKDLLIPEIGTTAAPVVSGKQTKQQQQQQHQQQPQHKQAAQSLSQQKQQQYHVQDTSRQAHVTQQRPSTQSRQAQQHLTPQPQHNASTVVSAEPKSTGKRQRRQVARPEEEKKEEKEVKPKKKKKRKVKKEKAGSPMDIPIDPDEPTYCLCDQVSYGEMIGCDNEECKIEWFHFNCVNLNQKPKGKWYCPNCRGETSKVPRKDLK